MWAEKNKHFRDFVWWFQFNSLPVWRVGARGAREREGAASVFTLIPSDSSLNSLGIDCHAFLPSMDNQSLFFLRSLQWARELWALFSYWEKRKASDLWAFTLLVTHLRTKLHLTSAFGNLSKQSSCRLWAGKLRERQKDRKGHFLHIVSTVSSAFSSSVLQPPLPLPANSYLGQRVLENPTTTHVGLPDKQARVCFCRDSKGTEQRTMKINVGVMLCVTAGRVVPDDGHWRGSKTLGGRTYEIKSPFFNLIGWAQFE